MQKTRLEAFSDGVLAIIITIMVLELKVPHDPSPAALLKLLPTLFASLSSSPPLPPPPLAWSWSNRPTPCLDDTIDSESSIIDASRLTRLAPVSSKMAFSFSMLLSLMR
jgi:hypothetical protein